MPENKSSQEINFGQQITDFIARIVGSWSFIILQSALIVCWVLFNTLEIHGLNKWDPYPFILLNLFLSFQAAYTAPMIVMSQNRQNEKDREQARQDYYVNILAEKEIEIIIDSLEKIQEKLNLHQTITESLKQVQTEINAVKNLVSPKE